MVNITFIGMDLYLVGEVSKKYHSTVANVFGIDESELFFSSFDSFVYYKGHEQTSFNLLVKVECDAKYKQIESKIADVILELTKNYSIHAQVYFVYFEEKSVYSRVNDSYPRFLMNDGNEEEEEDSSEETTEEDVYTGNIFEKFDKEHPEDTLGSFEEEMDESTSYKVFNQNKKQ